MLMTLFSVGCTGNGNSAPPGLSNGRLAPCPASPNCVSTETEDPEKRMEALAFSSDLKQSKEKILGIIREMPRTEVLENREEYIHATFTSALFRFVDDVEFYFDQTSKTIHFRSASRTGYSDLGANRKRMSRISELYLNN